MTNTEDKKMVVKGVRQAVYSMIEQGKFTKQQIIDAVSQDWKDVKAITIATYLSDAKNIKYTKAPKVAIEDPKTKIFMFSK